jgi:hypothetical protein
MSSALHKSSSLKPYIQNGRGNGPSHFSLSVI